MKTLPINVVVEGLPVLVIGGDFEAYEKVEKLLAFGAEITVLSPTLNADLTALRDDEKIVHLAERYTPDNLEGFRLVFVGDLEESVRERIRSDSRELGLLFNAVDMPHLCDFIMPACVQGRNFTIAICTGGKAAGLSCQLREQLEASVAQEDEILDVLDSIRTIFKRKFDTFSERREHVWAILKELEAIEKKADAKG
ncbi:MAG: bifunctional precorrin-2 dehydrogenase/sirohydrochlorin ferrochelatase [Verrucomicrobia bacterium]|nr:bifunctional precorrin-2 dehydrogenase/sirohydrochlorin ferrochelatase [Verrucomicrobiota bacterium]